MFIPLSKLPFWKPGTEEPVTLNALERVTTSVPVVIVTERSPDAAVDEIVMFADALVLLLTVRLLIVMSEPNVAVVMPWTKLVNRRGRLSIAAAQHCRQTRARG